MSSPITSAALSVTRGTVSVNADGSALVELRYIGSGPITSRILRIPANRLQPITDTFGNTISVSVPVALGSAIDAFATQIDAEIGAAASGNLLNL